MKIRQFAVAAAAVAIAFSPVLTGATGHAADNGPQPTPLDIVIAVDESGSLSDSDVKQEIAASSEIAQSGLNSRTRITVIGFGSNNGLPGQQAVDVVCQPTVADGAVNLQSLADCVKKLHRRTQAEGYDTDHVAALSQSLSVLGSGSPAGALKVIFLLTDGVLDVHDSPNYGNGDRNAEAQRQLEIQFKLAAAGNVQIWPLGFGEADQSRLDAFAAGASQQACDRRADSKPRARVVRSSGDVTRSLLEAYAAASCSGLGPTDSGTVGPGQSLDLHVAIPVIATDGSITVNKGDKNIGVEYVAPDGTHIRTSGPANGSSFTRSGENTATENLRIKDPVNGTWTVHLTAPPNLGQQLVSATALWQGAVRTSIVAEPPNPQTGQKMVIRLSLLTRKGAVTDAKSLQGLTFHVTATGPGLPGPQDVVMRDDGQYPDDVAADGRYAGTFTAPNTAGPVTFTGFVDGSGIHDDPLPLTVNASAEAATLQGKVEFDQSGSVYRGGTVSGTATLTNGTGSPVRVRLALDGPGQAEATVSPNDSFELPPGQSTKKFKVAFGQKAAVGGTSLTVKVAQEADLSKVFANGQLTITVKKIPGLLEKLKWWIAGGTFLLVAAGALLWIRRRRERARVDVRGLFAGLRRDGEPLGQELKAPSRRSNEFRFVVRDLSEQHPRLDYPRPADAVYTAKRGRDGQVRVRTAEGEVYEVQLGGAGEPLGETGVSLTFRDARRARRMSAPRRRTAQPAPSRPVETESVYKPAPTVPDDPYM